MYLTSPLGQQKMFRPNVTILLKIIIIGHLLAAQSSSLAHERDYPLHCNIPLNDTASIRSRNQATDWQAGIDI